MTVSVEGFKASTVLEQMHQQLGQTDAWKSVNSVFQFDIKNQQGAVQSWQLNMKNPPSPQEIVSKGTAAKADIVIAVTDNDFIELASGKLNGQKAFMAGKIKVKVIYFFKYSNF